VKILSDLGLEEFIPCVLHSDNRIIINFFEKIAAFCLSYKRDIPFWVKVLNEALREAKIEKVYFEESLSKKKEKKLKVLRSNQHDYMNWLENSAAFLDKIPSIFMKYSINCDKAFDFESIINEIDSFSVQTKFINIARFDHPYKTNVPAELINEQKNIVTNIMNNNLNVSNIKKNGISIFFLLL
jgi:hypothetical protein